MAENEKNTNTAEVKKSGEVAGQAGTQTANNQDGVNNIEMISKDDAQKMVDKALAKNLPPKEEMESFKKWKEAQKTETEKQAEIQKELAQKEQEKVNLKNENLVLKAGVNSDDVDYVLFKVSKMEGDFEDNLANFLKGNVKYLKSNDKNADQKDTGTSVKKEGVSKESGVTAILKAKHPNLYE